MAALGLPRMGRTAGFVGVVLAMLLAAGCSLHSPASQAPVSRQAVAVAVAAEAGPVTRDSDGSALRAEHAGVVEAVHTALHAGDLAALRELYTGDDWAAQAALLERPEVRGKVHAALHAAPMNLGEGYVYGERGYETGFFLAPEDGGPLQWRGIQVPSDVTDPSVAS